jgi:hypothetical protein
MKIRWRVGLHLAMALTLAMAAGSCKAKRRVRVDTVEEESGPLASVVRMSEPKTAVQLVRGFYALESGAWRWTKSQFSVTLRPPAGAAQNGAKLEMKMTTPEAVLAKIQTMTLFCTVNGQALDPEKIGKAGDLTYRREVSATALTGDAATFDFHFDKFLAAGQVEERELAAIVLSVGLYKK